MKRLPILLGLLIVLTGLAGVLESYAAENEAIVINYPDLPEVIPVMIEEEIADKHVTVPGKWQTLLWGFVVGVMVLSIATKKPRPKPGIAE